MLNFDDLLRRAQALFPEMDASMGYSGEHEAISDDTERVANLAAFFRTMWMAEFDRDQSSAFSKFEELAALGYTASLIPKPFSIGASSLMATERQ